MITAEAAKLKLQGVIESNVRVILDEIEHAINSKITAMENTVNITRSVKNTPQIVRDLVLSELDQLGYFISCSNDEEIVTFHIRWEEYNVKS